MQRYTCLVAAQAEFCVSIPLLMTPAVYQSGVIFLRSLFAQNVSVCVTGGGDGKGGNFEFHPGNYQCGEPTVC